MPRVFAEKNVLRRVHDNRFNGGGADIETDMIYCWRLHGDLRPDLSYVYSIYLDSDRQYFMHYQFKNKCIHIEGKLPECCLAQAGKIDKTTQARAET